MTGVVAKTMLDLELQDDTRLGVLLQLLKDHRRVCGGWICRRSEDRSPYCILGGTPWAFAALAKAGVYREPAEIEGTLEILSRHKEKIARHGYQRDFGCRCDETLLLPALMAVGLTSKHALVRYFYNALIHKQQSDGSWLFGNKASPWYSLEAVYALQAVESQ